MVGKGKTVKNPDGSCVVLLSAITHRTERSGFSRELFAVKMEVC